MPASRGTPPSDPYDIAPEEKQVIIAAELARLRIDRFRRSLHLSRLQGLPAQDRDEQALVSVQKTISTVEQAIDALIAAQA